MIDEILKRLFEKWNTEQKCGKCWVYVKSLNDHIKGTTNTFRVSKDDKCCTHVFLEGVVVKPGKKINDFIGMATLTHCDYMLHFKIVELSDFQMQKGSELKYDDGIYDKHVQPLIDCISCNFDNDVCSMFNGDTGIVFNEQTSPIFSFGDENWSGIDHKVTVRQYYS